MNITYTLYALIGIPLAVALEFLFGRRLSGPLYQLDETVINVLSGLFEETLLLLYGGALLVPYSYIAAHWSIGHFAPNSVWAWVTAFLAIEFFYYWFHRLAHRVNVIWAMHSIHHQSNRFNLSVALRQELGLIEWLFYLPVAFLGIDPVLFISVYTLTQLYQLPIHTRVVGRLGYLDRIFNTPSNHRVHHGSDAEYLDKNFGAVLMVWDWVFGTYAKEGAEPTYGLVHRWEHLDIPTAFFGYAVALARMSATECRGWDRLRIWIKPPDWQQVTVRSLQKMRWPVALRYLPALLATVVVGCGIWLQTQADHLPRSRLTGVALAVAAGCLLVTKGLESYRQPPRQTV